MGSVERVLVLGIVVVIVAILGIAVWGATGDDAAPLASAATDGGAAVADGAASPAINKSRKSDGPAAVDEIERWKQAREDLRNQVKKNNPALKPEGAKAKSLNVKPDLEAGPGVATKPPAEPKSQPAVSKPAEPKTEPVKPKAKPKGRVTHTVVSGDTLYKIRYKYFGDSDIQQTFDAILAANPTLDPDEWLQIGQKIVIPLDEVASDAPATPVAAAPKKAEFGGDLYEVAEGDTLSEIASRMLGSSQRWDDIYQLNRDRIVAPDKLQVGMTLRLPKN
jgi:nucleoid-associated protein YgaU